MFHSESIIIIDWQIFKRKNKKKKRNIKETKNKNKEKQISAINFRKLLSRIVIKQNYRFIVERSLLNDYLKIIKTIRSYDTNRLIIIKLHGYDSSSYKHSLLFHRIDRIFSLVI